VTLDIIAIDSKVISDDSTLNDKKTESRLFFVSNFKL
jgi:hypothetical protein